MEAVLVLIQELADFENESNAVVVTVADLVRDGFSSTPLFQVFVAEVDAQIVGIALYYYRYSTQKKKNKHLEDLVVKENWRGSGVGFALYSEVIKQGKKDKVRRIEWNVLDWNTPAVNFYKKQDKKILEDWRVVQMDEAAINYFVENKLK